MSTLPAPSTMFNLNLLNHILAHPIVGNAFSDAPLMTAIDAFAFDTSNSFEDRAAVLNHMQIFVMGIPLTTRELNLTDKAFVEEYIAGC